MTTHSITVIKMDAWVYLFSKFSHEALLFEALALFLGLFGYAIFYLIRKRKYGVAGKDVPSNIVKIYLAQLMGDAEEIRNQLFGLLGKHEASAIRAGMQFQADPFEGMRDTTGTGAVAAGAATPAPASVAAAADPRLNEKLKELERRLSEQAGALDAVLNDKMKLEEELANARARATATNEEAKDSDGGPDRTAPMAERLRQLEAQLAEYAIIEDDLANLKRLQKENKTLKEQLNIAGVVPPTATATPAVNAAPAAAAPKPAAAAAAVMPDLSDSDQPADFESLVDVVEKNLADSNKSANVNPNTETSAPEFNLEAGSASEQKSDEKSEEQLQADFEKMLNS